MARFDYYRVDGRLLVDCQADLMRHLTTRVVAPLYSPDDMRSIVERLHPRIEVGGEQMVLVTELLTAVPSRDLGRPQGSLAAHEYTIMAALDLLLTGV